MHDRVHPFPWLTWVLAGIAAGLLAHPGWSSALELTDQAFLQGQLWRIWTGHWVHFGLAHGMWDVAALLVLGAGIESGRFGLPPLSRPRLIRLLGTAGAVIAATVVVVHPELARYRGLSGLATTLFAWTAGSLLRKGSEERRPSLIVFSSLAVLGLLGKSLYEAAGGASLFVDAAQAGFVPVPVAHLAGACVGLLVSALASRPQESSGLCPAATEPAASHRSHGR